MNLFKKKKNIKNGEGPIERLKLSSAQQMTLLIICGVSILIGAGVVLVIWFVKYIGFNNGLIAEMDDSIAGYSKTIEEIGVCVKPTAKDGIYTTDELEKCVPDMVSADTVPETLKSNVLLKMGANANLESVGRVAAPICYNASGVKYDQAELIKKYQESEGDEKRDWLQTWMLCSSLRTITDALPTKANENTVFNILDTLYKISGYALESSSPSKNNGESEIPNVFTIPVGLSFDGGDDGGRKTLALFRSLEDSIRIFDVETAKITWDKGTIVVEASANAYYTHPTVFEESSKTITAASVAARKK